MAAATARRTIDGAAAGAGVDACLNWQARGDANISGGGGTLHPWGRCQPIPKRSGIGDPPQSAVQNDQIYLGLGDFRASGRVVDGAARLRVRGASGRSRCVSQGRPAGRLCGCRRLRQSDLAEHRVILPARCGIGCNHSRGAPCHRTPLKRI